MKQKFQTFYERKVKNPLRKNELDGETNWEYVKKEKENLPQKRKDQIKKMEELGVEPERIETFRQAKIKEYEKELKNDFFRPKLETPKLVLKKYGIRVFTDKYTEVDFIINTPTYRGLVNTINKFVRDYKDVIPNRKPKVVITNFETNPVASDNRESAGFYYDGWIYIDESEYKNVGVWVHENAHYITSRIPSQAEPILKAGYREMLNEYFVATTGKKTKKRSLQGDENKKHRKQMAKKMGLPDEYAATNFDEWFAVLIENWKSMPNNRHTYRFKQLIKKVLNRI